tara:strand:- start:633 stop:854 length:222 start_codon:yes stop_codon:yes gene_type:complete
MTVQELIDILEGYESDGQVLFVVQPNCPFEYSIADVVERADFEGSDEETGARRNDVILVEGSQLRYGNKHMFP